MSLVVLCSVHGAPGATTATLVLAAGWPEDRGRMVVMEADPAGGVLAPRFGLGDTPGLVSLAAAARHGLGVDMVFEHTQVLAGGLPVVVGSASPEQTARVLSDITPGLISVARSAGVDVVADAGRLFTGSPTMELVVRADVVLVVARPVAEQLRLVASRIEALRASGADPVVVLVGDAPYGPGEVASTLDVEVAGVLAWDPRSADALAGSGYVRGGLRRLPLARSASTLAGSLAGRLPRPDVGKAAGDGAVSGVMR